ncbi:unnamed protein product [Phaeothamnion confervicola]
MPLILGEISGERPAPIHISFYDFKGLPRKANCVDSDAPAIQYIKPVVYVRRNEETSLLPTASVEHARKQVQLCELLVVAFVVTVVVAVLAILAFTGHKLI